MPLADSTFSSARPAAGSVNSVPVQVRDANKSQGQCILYKSMQTVMKDLAREGEERDKWLIVLTDLVDLEHPYSQNRVDVLKTQMAKLQGLSLVVVDSQKISGYEPHNERWPTWRKNMDELVDGLASEGATSLHIACDSGAEITAAFQRVAAMMGGMSEAL